MPVLGKYAVTVLSAYGLSLLFLVGLVAWSYLRWRGVKAELQRQENSQDV
ncbi:MAG: heme exporter protein CcmD [Rhodobacteraceae bacterium]|jgi:heme exporter protein D|nr:heme exporter protein CcmD [Paracoccaceae bacterium]MBT6543480.1 heme exporter protein CcmD [Paracoccaceae bacterium]MDE2633514.1 heme exporter protein CcmD [Paracoccaceae bacterium]HBS38824.1 heme exporter protein CcmD [Paracoccaceae bacterium]|tara:strand:- start:975 stop:1124 length:150 start_codon:yes stop_codon:yes gene_type:complete